jgi:hypothetical protein
MLTDLYAHLSRMTQVGFSRYLQDHVAHSEAVSREDLLEGDFS